MEVVEMNREFWHGKRVFLTGHTGFKGSWLALWLQSLGAEVHGFALEPPTEPNLYTVASVGDGMASSVIVDIRDGAMLTASLQAAKPEIVFHLAAQALVRYSYVQPVETYAINVIGTVNLLEAVRATPGVHAVVNVTSDKCYENREWVWGYREHEPMGGHDPYSSSKGCAELVTAAYRRSFFDQAGVALASARAGNVIGGGDWADDRLLPDMVRAFLRHEPALLRRPDAVRPWQHVLDPLHGYLQLVERLWDEGGRYAEAWNFGPDEADARPVSWVADRMVALWGDGASWRHDNAPQPHEAGYLKLDCAKAKTRLNWYPGLALDSALEWSVDWYKAYQRQQDLRRVTLNQIDRYQAMACA